MPMEKSTIYRLKSALPLYTLRLPYREGVEAPGSPRYQTVKEGNKGRQPADHPIAPVIGLPQRHQHPRLVKSPQAKAKSDRP